MLPCHTLGRLTARDRILASILLGLVSATSLPNVSLAQSPTLRINSGGGSYTNAAGSTWSADTAYSGGTASSRSNAIENTTDDPLYQQYRWGSFSYGLPVANGSYTLKLHFAEPYWGSAGKRKFDVEAEGTVVLDNFDIFAAAGGQFRAVTRSFPVTVSDGRLDLDFLSVVDHALISAIELVPVVQSPFKANVGGGQYASSTTGTWAADSGFVGGTTATTTATIAGTADPALYQSERWGNFSYSVPVPNGTYTLHLHFSENYFSAAGRRKFDVLAENTVVLNDFDIYAAAGARYRAVVRSIPVTVSDGRLDLNFAGVVDNAKIDAIELATGSGTPAPAPAPTPTPTPTPTNGALSFSAELTPYPIHPTASSRSVDEIYNRTANPAIALTSEYVTKRKEIISMFKNFGIDISLDLGTLSSMRPTNWSRTSPLPLTGNFPLPHSIDAPFYKKIPASYPRVALPLEYFKSGHISTLGPPGDGSDGFGIGVVVGKSTDPARTLRLEVSNGYANRGECPSMNSYTGYNVSGIRIPNSANYLLGGNGYAIPNNTHDRAVVWVDEVSKTPAMSWMSVEACNPYLGDWAGMWINKERAPLPNLGDSGGISAAQIGGIVTLIRPGELTNPNQPIQHALSGPTKKAWKSVVYPGNNWDATIDGLNSGLLGYGMLVQLDPNLNLGALNLSLPARRILEAIQNYGWYMDDTGVRDFDLKGNFSASELAPYGGVGAVDAEVMNVIKNNKMYVVPPLVKR